MQSSAGRLELLETALQHLRDELVNQAAQAEQEQRQISQHLTDLLDDHRSLELSLHSMEQQLQQAHGQLAQQAALLRDKDYTLAQLQAALADRQRQLDRLRRQQPVLSSSASAVSLPSWRVLSSRMLAAWRQTTLPNFVLILVFSFGVGTLMAQLLFGWLQSKPPANATSQPALPAAQH